jgi:hypothetical protein
MLALRDQRGKFSSVAAKACGSIPSLCVGGLVRLMRIVTEFAGEYAAGTEKTLRPA